MKIIKDKKGIVGNCCESPSILYTIIILVFGIVVGGIIIFDYQSIKPQEEGFVITDVEKAQAEARYYYKQENMRVVNETGLPKQESCEAIKIRIKTEVFPKHIITYHCKSSPEEEERFCQSYTNPNTKESFVKYYLLNCLEEREI